MPVELNGGASVGGSGSVFTTKRKKAPPAPPEPHGQGLRVVMQKLSVTANGILDQPFMFQVPPLDEFPREYQWNFQDYDTVGDGMHTRAQSRQLTTISFDSLFVDQDAPFVVNKKTPYNPVALIDELLTIGDSQTPFQLLAGQPDLWGVYYDVNMAVTMRSLRASEKSGERDARYFSISFTEFRGVAQSELTAGLKSDAAKSGNKVLAVLNIDALPPNLRTLRAISKKYYGTTGMWSVIAKESGLSVAGDVNLKTRYAAYIPKPKIIVPAAQRKG